MIKLNRCKKTNPYCQEGGIKRRVHFSSPDLSKSTFYRKHYYKRAKTKNREWVFEKWGLNLTKINAFGNKINFWIKINVFCMCKFEANIYFDQIKYNVVNMDSNPRPCGHKASVLPFESMQKEIECRRDYKLCLWARLIAKRQVVLGDCYLTSG